MKRRGRKQRPDDETIDDAPEPAPRRSGSVFVSLLVLIGVLCLAGGGFALLFGRPDGGIPRKIISLTGPSPDVSGLSETGRPDTASAAPAMPQLPAARGLVPAPVAAVLAQSRQGPVPQIAKDGRTPMEVYARPFDMKDPRPRIALIISGLGLSRQVTDNAIQSLPPQVTLSFAPYPKDVQLLVAAARAAGHEVMIEVPMEPFDYPRNDPGPYTLLQRADTAENLDKLEWVMSRFTGYSGILNEQGDKLLGSTDDLKPVLNVFKMRGVYFVDRGDARRSVAGDVARALGLSFSTAVASIDASASREGIDLQLLHLEQAARESGSAIGIGLGYPVTIDRITAWAADLDAKGLALAPVSAVVTAAASHQAER